MISVVCLVTPDNLPIIVYPTDNSRGGARKINGSKPCVSCRSSVLSIHFIYVSMRVATVGQSTIIPNDLASIVDAPRLTPVGVWKVHGAINCPIQDEGMHDP